MSNSNLQNFGKCSGTNSSTIGYRFSASDEGLQELHSKPENDECTKGDSNTDVKTKPAMLTSGSLDGSKCEEEKNSIHGEAAKDYWGLLGRSISVDSTYESPFSNPIETWRKLNELKGKITKTVEEKISEMKMDRNVSSHSRLINSKENSSISDSEDTSESSKLSEQWKDAEDLNLSLKEVINKTTDMLSTTLDAALQNVKSEMEAEVELRNRKSHTKFSELMKIPDIKIATAKNDNDGNILDENLAEDIESGVEAQENLNSTLAEELDEPSYQISFGSSQTPPDGNDILSGFISSFTSIKLLEVSAVVFLFGFVLYVFLPMSDFSRGFLFCLLFVLIFMKLKNYLYEDEPSYLQQGSFVMPDFKSLPPLKVPQFKSVKGVWFNEYQREFYDPDYYSVTQTVPAYLELENSILKLSHTKEKISKRATFDEPNYKLQFSNQRVYNISGCNVFLMPEGLTRKRLFSKKYPIVIFLKPDSFICEKNNEEKENSGTPDSDNMKLPTVANGNKCSLYLFARCDRQKEEWYRKLLAATRLTLLNDEKVPEEETEKENGNEASTPFENVFFDPEVAQVEEYLRYMAKFMDIETTPPEEKSSKAPEMNGRYKKKKSKKKVISPYSEDRVEEISSVTACKKGKNIRTSRLQLSDDKDCEENGNGNTNPNFEIHWFNALVNRLLFDIFRSPYWLARIQDKVYRKLNSIRLPYYVEDIEVIEMDLGKTGPMFHRASPPYIDERGLWFDMDTTFDGLIKITIQTHLNLIKLQRGMEEEQLLRNALEKPEKGKKKAKEMRDQFLIKDSGEKPRENLNQTHEQSKKQSLPSKSSSDDNELDDEDEFSSEAGTTIPENDFNLEFKPSEIKLLREVAKIAEITIGEKINNQVQKSPIYDSDVEDSPESSDDDLEEEEVPSSQGNAESTETTPISIAKRYPKNRRSSKKLFRMFENVAQSKYFKSVAQSKYIQKAMAGVSATKLKLTLEMRSCSGTLAINIPPPPSDRFWYGFREMPKINLSVNPKIGEKTVRFSQIKNYLHRKILYEIKKAMVAPNMIDLVLLTSAPGRSSSSLQTEQPNSDNLEVTSPE